MSLRSQVFSFLDNNDVTDVKVVYKRFPDSYKNTVERYYYIHKKLHATDISLDIELENIDTIKWMERTIQRIKDPVKLAENISRLHSMKLKPLANKEQISLKEMLDAS